MQLIQKITLDFAENGIPPKVFGKQDDSGASRAVVISLYNAGVAFDIPSGAAFMLRYKTPSGAFGLYDTMPDGSVAMAAEENRVTVQLVDQIFASPGRVSCELRIIADGAGVSTWKWYVDVEGSNAADATIPSDYINVLTNLASEVAANASRAEQAASQITPESLLHKNDYDPTGAVVSAGGIVEYVKNNSQAEPELFITTINDSDVADHTHAEIYAAYQSGKLCVCCVPRFTNEFSILNGVSSTYASFASAMKGANSNSVLIRTVKITSADEVTVSSISLELSDSVTSTSSTTAASSAAVKTAYDKANSAYNLANAKPSKTSGTPTLSKYGSYPAPSLFRGGWERIGNFVMVSLSINTNQSASDGKTDYFCIVSGLPTPLDVSAIKSYMYTKNDVSAEIFYVPNTFLGIKSNVIISGNVSIQFSYLAA